MEHLSFSWQADDLAQLGGIHTRSHHTILVLPCPYRNKNIVNSCLLIDFLIQYGYWGMLVAAFIAGSFFPFTSEAVMMGLQAAGLNPVLLIIYGAIGNIGGSMFNYFIGRFAGAQWAVHWLHVKPEQLDKAKCFINGNNKLHLSGAWLGFFAFLPVLGSAIAIALGMMKANIGITIFSISIGKILRYVILVAFAGILI